MAASECCNALASRLVINLQLTKNMATIVSVDVTKSHVSCFFSKDNKIILAFYEQDTLTCNKGRILALIY